MEMPKLLTEVELTTKFKKDEIDDDTIGHILDAASHVPSAGNLQPWKFIVVKDEDLKEKLSKAALNLNFIKTAPAVIVICGDVERAYSKYSVRGEKLYVVQDIAFSSLMVYLACRSLGLGCYLVRAFEEEEVIDMLEIPDGVRPFAIIPIGNPESKGESVNINPFEDVTFIDKYGSVVDKSLFYSETMSLEEKFRKMAEKRKKK